jgi:hypothetical protein
VVVALALAGCYTDLPADGALRCNTQAAKMCPTSFYCADDGACWRNGHAPGTNAGDDLSASGLDLATGEFDLSGSKACTTDVCAGNTLRTCNAMNMYDDTACPLGCSSTGGPHCSALVPQAPVSPADLDATGLVAITTTTTIHGDTGAIDGLRNANVNASAREVNNGIAFHVANGIAVFSFQSLKVEESVTVHLAGANPIALAAATDVEIIGQVEARLCPAGGVGGAPSAVAGQNGTGQGFGSSATQASNNGGGAGHGDKGGHGATDMAMPTDGFGGAIYDGVSLSPLHGGSSGAGGTPAAGGTGGVGGAGGGAIQIVAGHAVYLGGGTQAGGINAGGCGCGRGVGSGATGSGGGGGGSGGAILIESPTIEFRTNGGLAANGGGGGSFATSSLPSDDGSSGSLSTMRAAAGIDGGGRGGAAGATLGESSDFGLTPGGGGGGVGRVRLNSANGATLPASYILSPGLNDMNALGQPVATQGTISVQ